MSATLFTRITRGMCALLLLVSITALVPTQRASADEQKVQLTDEQVKQAMWNANWDEKTPRKGSKIEGLLLSYFMTNAQLQEQPNDDNLIELQRRYFNALGPRGTDPDYRDNLSTDQIVRAFFTAANTMPIFNQATTETWIQLNKLPALVPEPDFIEIADSVRAFSFDDTLLAHGGEVQAATLERAKQDPQFASVFDKVFSQGLGVSIKDFVADTFDTGKFIADHPELAVPQPIRDGINSDGSVAISLNDLKSLATNEYGKINASIDDLQLTLVTLESRQIDLADYMRNQQARQAAEALAKAKAQEHQLKLQAADSSIFIISTLAGFIDPKVGNQIATVGRSALQIGESLNTWMNAVAGLNTLDKVTSLSTVVMTGNVLSAVMHVVSLFGSDQPTPDQMILQEIGKLRQQVDQLRTDMHDRFDRVDKELNTIYTTMQDRFDKIDVQLGTITTSLDEIQQTLDKLSLDLSRLQHDNFEFLDALGRRPLRDAINGAIGYKQRTGVDMPYQPDFVGYENTFQTWGTINAFDALSAGPTQRDYSDGQVLTELNAYPLDANLNYLNGWLGAHGMTPFASKRLASPRDWAFASRAYADIGFDWPAYMKRIDPRRQAALDAVGNDLETAMHTISTIDTPNGPQGNAPLFDGVMAYYNAKLGAINTSIQSTESAYSDEVRGQLQRDTPFNMFGGVDQHLEYQSPAFITMDCNGLTDNLAPPSTLQAQTSNLERYTLADYLHIGTLTTCVTTTFKLARVICQPGKDACDAQGTLQAFVDVSFNNVSLEEHTLPLGTVIVPAETLPIDYVLQRWDSGLKDRFEAQSTEVAPTPALIQQRAELLNTTTTSLQDKLRTYQQELYKRVINNLANGTQHPAAVELAGAKKLLDSFVTLGFSQATDNDDFLRSLLFSDQQLPDDQQIIATYAASINAASSDTQLTTNPRLTINGTSQKRRDALSGLLHRYLDGISAQTYSEDTALVADTRLDLRLARSFADTGSPSSPSQPTPTQPTPAPTQPTQPPAPGQTRSIFLPLVMR